MRMYLRKLSHLLGLRFTLNPHDLSMCAQAGMAACILLGPYQKEGVPNKSSM